MLVTFNMTAALIMTTITCCCACPPDEIDLANQFGDNFNVEASESHYIDTIYKEEQEKNNSNFDLWNVWDQL